MLLHAFSSVSPPLFSAAINSEQNDTVDMKHAVRSSSKCKHIGILYFRIYARIIHALVNIIKILLLMIMIENLTKQAILFFFPSIYDRNTTQSTALRTSVLLTRPTLQAVTVNYLIHINIMLDSIYYSIICIYTIRTHRAKP